MVIFFNRDGSNAYEYEPKCQADWNATEHAAKYAESMESAIHEECCSRKNSFLIGFKSVIWKNQLVYVDCEIFEHHKKNAKS